MRSTDRFRSWQSALWYCLRAARDPADALLILRAAQLAMLERRIHLTMQSGPWEAAEAARQHVAGQSSNLLALHGTNAWEGGGLARGRFRTAASRDDEVWRAE